MGNGVGAKPDQCPFFPHRSVRLIVIDLIGAFTPHQFFLRIPCRKSTRENGGTKNDQPNQPVCSDYSAAWYLRCTVAVQDVKSDDLSSAARYNRSYPKLIVINPTALGICPSHSATTSTPVYSDYKVRLRLFFILDTNFLQSRRELQHAPREPALHSLGSVLFLNFRTRERRSGSNPSGGTP